MQSSFSHQPLDKWVSVPVAGRAHLSHWGIGLAVMSRVCSHSVGPWEDAPGPPRRSSSCMAPRAGRQAWVQGHLHLLSEQLQTPSRQKEEASVCIPRLPLTTTELFLIRPRCSDPGAVKSPVMSGPRITEAPSSFCFLRWVS